MGKTIVYYSGIPDANRDGITQGDEKMRYNVMGADSYGNVSPLSVGLEIHVAEDRAEREMRYDDYATVYIVPDDRRISAGKRLRSKSCPNVYRVEYVSPCGHFAHVTDEKDGRKYRFAVGSLAECRAECLN